MVLFVILFKTKKPMIMRTAIQLLAFLFVFINIEAQEVLTTSYVEDSNSSDENEKVVTALGIKKDKNEIGTAYAVVKRDNLIKANSPNIIQSLTGKVSGLQIVKTSSGLKIFLRGTRSLKSNNEALIVIDGVVSSSDFLEALDPNSVESVSVLKGANGAALYGSQGSNGALLITTKKIFQKSNEELNENNSKVKYYSGKLKVDLNQDTPKYIKEIKKANSLSSAYDLYLKQKDNYKQHSSYYLDIYNYFSDNFDYKKKILNDIIKYEYDNYDILKGLAFKLEEKGEYKSASSVFKRVLMKNQNYISSYRNLALAYAEIGMSNEAFSLLNSILNTKEIKGTGMFSISKNEINNLIQNNPTLDKTQLENSNLLYTGFDLRVLVDWSSNNSDIDLHIIEPSKEICYYNNPVTQIGGEISQDMHNGLGPEEYILKNAKKGDYFVKLTYDNKSAENTDKESTFAKLTIFKNYGKPNQIKTTKVVKLDKNQGEVIVAKITI